MKCEEDQFECDNGLCIQHQWVCDGQYFFVLLNKTINNKFNSLSTKKI